MVKLLNKFVANQMVFYVKLHNLHWYVKGHQFFKLHEKFEEQYDNAAEVLDEVAERMLIIGETPVASLADALKIATISERAAGPVSSDESVKILQQDLQQLSADASELIKVAADAGDDVTADLFTGYAADYQKTLWFLRAYLAK